VASYRGDNHRGEYTHNVVTCKRCGNPNCVWVESRKTGKFYLVEHAGVGTPDLDFYYVRTNFHKCKESSE
jgi:hypothetical protein